MRLSLLADDHIEFPHSRHALREPNGLLAVGGDLSAERLLAAYRRGIFPWYNPEEPILWWSPDPRAVLFPEKLHVSRTVKKQIRQCHWHFSCDRAFAGVIDACAAPRADQAGTWISPEMREAYLNLHRLGFAHSVEVWDGDKLIGGLYGIALGRVFFGESMFSLRSGASRLGFIHLVAHLHQWGFQLIDCQTPTDYLVSMGAELIPRARFESILVTEVDAPCAPGAWQMSPDMNFPGESG